MIARLRARESGLAYWVVVGFLVSFGAVAILSIGFPFLVLGLLLFARGAWRDPVSRKYFGMAVGIGITCLVLAALNAVDGPGSFAVWAGIGLGWIAIGGGALWLLERRRPRPGAGATSA